MHWKNVQIDTQIVPLKGHTLEGDKKNKQTKMQDKKKYKNF